MTVVASSRALWEGKPLPSSLSRTNCSQPQSASAHACWISESVPSVSQSRCRDGAAVDPARFAQFVGELSGAGHHGLRRVVVAVQRLPQERREFALEVITGRTDYRGEGPGLAALMYQIGMVMFWTSMLSYWQAIALADANGLTAADILPHAVETANSLPGFFSFYSERIDAGRHMGDVDRLAMGMAGVEHVLHTNADAGVDTALPAAVADLFRRGMDTGHAEDSFSSLVKLMTKAEA